MNRREKAKFIRADAPHVWRRETGEIVAKHKANPHVNQLAKPLTGIKNVGDMVALEILTAVALQLAMDTDQVKVG